MNSVKSNKNENTQVHSLYDKSNLSMAYFNSGLSYLDIAQNWHFLLNFLTWNRKSWQPLSLSTIPHWNEQSKNVSVAGNSTVLYMNFDHLVESFTCVITV